ncbi:hypothetical protein BD408DRAFT_439706 [Parasitella parasitica]|nr:hypothetical protein BD408DRAFT_439706 [Parasitella parasitica]
MVLVYLECIFTLVQFMILIDVLVCSPVHDSSTIIAIGIDLNHIFDTNRSIVRVAASFINESGALSDTITTMSEFSTLTAPNLSANSERSISPKHMQVFLEAYQYIGSQCTNETDGFFFVNNDPLVLEEKLIELFKRIKYTTLTTYGLPNAKLHAVIVDSRYSRAKRSLLEAAAKRAGLPSVQIVGRVVAAAMICEQEEISEDHYYLEIHFDKNKIDIAVILDENGANVFETLAAERLNYTADGSEITPMLSSLLDRLIQNAEIPDAGLIYQVAITSSEPLTLSRAPLLQQLEALLNSYFNGRTLTFCNSLNGESNRIIPHEHRLAYSAAQYSQSTTKKQLYDSQWSCCVELSPMHYGVAVAGGLIQPIIPMNSILNGQKSAIFTIIMPQQQQPIKISLYRGFRLQKALNTYIGSLDFQNDDPLILVITIEISADSDELFLIIKDSVAGQTYTSTFSNDRQTVGSELAQFDKNWDPEQFDLNRFIDQQLKEKVDLIVSKYVSTTIDSLQERFFKKMRFFLLPASKRQYINDLIYKSDGNKLTTTEKKLHSLPLE